MTYLEMEAMQKAKLQAKQNPSIAWVEDKFEELKIIARLAKTLNPEQRQDFINEMLKEDADVDLVTAQDGK